MPKLTDMQIRAWIKAGDRFDGKADGNGLYICYPKNYTVPFWRFRYKLAGKQRAMVIGSYSELSLSKARETAKELSARVALGYDVAAEKQEQSRSIGDFLKMLFTFASGLYRMALRCSLSRFPVPPADQPTVPVLLYAHQNTDDGYKSPLRP
jgi:hypothetical protein